MNVRRCLTHLTPQEVNLTAFAHISARANAIPSILFPYAHVHADVYLAEQKLALETPEVDALVLQDPPHLLPAHLPSSMNFLSTCTRSLLCSRSSSEPEEGCRSPTWLSSRLMGLSAAALHFLSGACFWSNSRAVAPSICAGKPCIKRTDVEEGVRNTGRRRLRGKQSMF